MYTVDSCFLRNMLDMICWSPTQYLTYQTKTWYILDASPIQTLVLVFHRLCHIDRMLKFLPMVPTAFTNGTGKRLHRIEQSGFGISTKQLHSCKQITSVKPTEKQRTGSNSQWTIRRLSTVRVDICFLQPTV